MAKSRYVFRDPKLTVGAIDIHPFITNMTLTTNAAGDDC